MSGWIDVRMETVASSLKPIERQLILLGFAIFVGLAALFMAADAMPPTRRGAMMALLVSFPVFIFWCGWGSRMMVLLLQARDLRIPMMGAGARDAMLAMAAITVVLPGLVCVAAGGHPGVVFGSLLLAGAGGLMFALAPRGLAPLLGFGVMGLSMLWRLDNGSLGVATLLPATALVLLLLLAWRALAVARNPEAVEDTGWSQPALFATAARGTFWLGRDMFDARSQLAATPRWAQRIDDLGCLGPDAPMRSLRVMLGGVLAPMHKRGLLVGMATWTLLLVLVWFYMLDGEKLGEQWRQLLPISLITGAAFMMAPLSMRIQALRKRHSGELTEAALLPGLSGDRPAHRLLLLALLRIHATWFVLFAAWMAGCVLLSGRVESMPSVLAATVGIGVLGIHAWMRPLAGQPWSPDAMSIALLLLPVLALAVLTLFAVMTGQWQPAAVATWVMVIVAAGFNAWRSMRRYFERPHPFLMD